MTNYAFTWRRIHIWRKPRTKPPMLPKPRQRDTSYTATKKQLLTGGHVEKLSGEYREGEWFVVSLLYNRELEIFVHNDDCEWLALQNALAALERGMRGDRIQQES